MTNSSRRSHTKSKNGCGQCKRRHIKCNLQAPVCFNCWKRDVWCDYQDLGSEFDSNPHDGHGRCEVPSGDVSVFQFAKAHMQLISRSNAYAWPINDPLTLHRQLQDPLLANFPNMELMKNFIENTSLEIDLVVDGDSIWQREAVQTSVRFPFLQHALMALSGLHIFHMNPPNSLHYYYTACRHSMRASELFRASVFSVDKSNWQPVLIFLIASVIFNLDIMSFDQTTGNSTHAIRAASILVIMRYPGLLSKQLISRLVSGSLATTLLRRQYYQCRVLIDEEVMCAIKSLAQLCNDELCSNPDAETYHDAIKLLELWAESVSCQPQSWHGLVDWPVAVSDRYIQLLEDEDEYAVVIFCYWCAVINRAPQRYYLVGVMRKLEMAKSVRLNPKWDTSLQWLRNEIQKLK
ncbi:hypothetical protein GGI35DRAFT_472183 [Trichoderma velutinum]